MKKVSKIIVTLLLAGTVSQAAFAAEIPIESAPRNATQESIAIVEELIADELAEIENGGGFQTAWAKASCDIREAVINGETNGYGYALLASIARNAIYQCRDMYLRPDYYAEQNEAVYNLIEDLIAEVQNDGDYGEALDDAYTRILQCGDPSYEPNTDADTIYLDIPTIDIVKFSRARKLLLEAIPQV